MTIIQIGKRYYTFPEKWNELSRKQLIRIMEVFHKDVTVEKANVLFFRTMAGLSWFRMKTRLIDVLEHMHLVEWLYEENDENLLTRNLIPEYKDFHGPADDFGNVSVLEYFWGEFFFQKWEETGEQQHLDMLAATLYRPLRKGVYDHKVNPDNDHREPFNQNLIETYYTTVCKWPKPVKLAIAKLYRNNFIAIRNKYPDPFESSGGSPSRFGFVPLLRDVAESGHYGTFSDVEKMNIHLFFMDLCISMERSKKL